MKDTFHAALKYQEMGLSVIPVQKSKKPYIAWEKHQKEKASEELIKEWWSKYPNANVAIVTGQISGLDVVDIDSEQAMNAIDEILPDSLITPVAKTPRGGRHYYHQSINGLGNATAFMKDCDFRGNGGYIVAPPSTGYSWLPDLSIFEVSPASLPDSVLKLLKESTQGAEADKVRHVVDFSQGNRDESLFHTALNLLKGGTPVEEVKTVIVALGTTCKPPFPAKEAIIKVESAMKRLEGGNRNFAQEVRDWIQVNTGTFATKDIFEELDISRQYKRQVSTILTRLVARDLIDRTSRIGIFRIVDKECPVIQWRKADIEMFDINWPLSVGNLVKIYPKNIIVIAGEADAGKTAYLLNLVDMNRDKKIFYFSSEMGSGEFKDRIDSFEGAEANWNHFHPFERSKDFADVIQPDHINIIDYLELTDAFYLVSGLIGKIFDKLNKGIAIIGLQMDEGAKFGRGRAFSMEKARLYMTISKNPPDGAILRILKAKKRARPDVNPNNQRCDFKIVNGTKLIQSEPWYYDYKKEGKK